MALTKAVSGSNASPGSGSMDVNTGPDESGYLGYVQVPFPSQMPAQANADVAITSDLKFSMVNQGTSLKAYDEQDETISSESGGGDTQSVTGE